MKIILTLLLSLFSVSILSQNIYQIHHSIVPGVSGKEIGETYYGQYFVDATNGDDSYSGTEPDSAWKTISKVNGESFSSGDTISFICGGVWIETLIIPASGDAADDIVFMSYGSGANPVISGLTEVTSWTNYSGDIYYKEIACDNDDLSLLVLDGNNTPMGREPESGIWNSYEGFNYSVDVNVDTIWDHELSGTPDYSGGEVVIRKQKWMLDRNVITSIVDDTLIIYEEETDWSLLAGYGYFFQNHYLTLDNHGEWYYDGDTLFMYFDTDPSNYTVEIATEDTVIDAQKDYVTIQDLTIQGADKWGIFLNDAQNTTIQNNNVLFCGGTGIKTDENSTNAILDINNNFIQDCNDEGIDFRGTNTVVSLTYNELNRIGILPGMHKSDEASCDGIQIVGTNSLAEHNVLDSIGHNGISSKLGDNHNIKYNVISGWGMTRYDAGSVYCYTNSNITITKNIIYNSKLTTEGLGGDTSIVVAGIYLDNDVEFATVDSNVVFNAERGFLFLNCDSSDIFDNLAYNNAYTQTQYIDMESSWGYGVDMVDMNSKRNRWISKDSTQWVLYHQDDDAGISETGPFDTNYYARAVDTVALIYTLALYTPTERNLSGWKTYSSMDTETSGSPIICDHTDSLQFDYNISFTDNKTFDFSQDTLQEVDGTKHADSVVLNPLEAMVLFPLQSSDIPAIYSDDFGTNYDPLHNDPSWSQAANNLKANNGIVYPVTLVPNRICAYYEGTFDNDQYAEVTLSATDNNYYIGAAVRASSNNFYGLRVDNNDYVLEKFVAGTPSDIATGAGTFAATDVIRLEVEGTTLRMYKNDVQFGGDQTDSDLATGNAGVCGYNYSPTTAATDWEGGDL